MQAPWDTWWREALPRVVPPEETLGGVIRSVPEDFVVEEVPAYQPSGEGEHAFLWVEKRDRNTQDVIRALARRLEVGEGEVGTAGMKDRRAVTRQFVSVPRAAAGRDEELSALLARGQDDPGDPTADSPYREGATGPSDGGADRSAGAGPVEIADGIRVLFARAHGNKLRTGHLRGNRFRIVIRGPQADALARLPDVLDRVRVHGLPNFFGEQRFGRGGETLAIGLDLLAGVRTRGRVGRGLSRLALSAVQSVLFNRVLVERMRGGSLHRALLGDLVQVSPAGGFFVVEDPAREQPRLDAGEILLTGPLFGRKVRRAREDAALLEEGVLAAAGLDWAAFEGQGKLLEGTRRPLLVRADGLAGRVEDDAVVLDFTLPAGAYATVLLREVMGEEGAGPR